MCQSFLLYTLKNSTKSNEIWFDPDSFFRTAKKVYYIHNCKVYLEKCVLQCKITHNAANILSAIISRTFFTETECSVLCFFFMYCIFFLL